MHLKIENVNIAQRNITKEISITIKHLFEYHEDLAAAYYEFSLGDDSIKERFYSLKYLSQILAETIK